MATVADNRAKIAWGPRLDLSVLEDLYAPRTVTPFTPPPGGIDNLGIVSTDTFMVPGKGEVAVEFSGYVRVARSEPTSGAWDTTEVYTNLIDMRMEGDAGELGPVVVTLNPDFLSAGQIRTPFPDEGRTLAPKACRMAVGALFSLPKLGLAVFNREPIILTIDDVQAIPPAGNPGEGRIYQMLPLFDRADPDGRPAAYLTSLKFAMGSYITEAQVRDLGGRPCGSQG
jgi:hypothetical protein